MYSYTWIETYLSWKLVWMLSLLEKQEYGPRMGFIKDRQREEKLGFDGQEGKWISK
jgi:hypothetical protein